MMQPDKTKNGNKNNGGDLSELLKEGMIVTDETAPSDIDDILSEEPGKDT